jgi:hypothetical protein
MDVDYCFLFVRSYHVSENGELRLVVSAARCDTFHTASMQVLFLVSSVCTGRGVSGCAGYTPLLKASA